MVAAPQSRAELQCTHPIGVSDGQLLPPFPYPQTFIQIPGRPLKLQEAVQCETVD